MLIEMGEDIGEKIILKLKELDNKLNQLLEIEDEKELTDSSVHSNTD